MRNIPLNQAFMQKLREQGKIVVHKKRDASPEGNFPLKEDLDATKTISRSQKQTIKKPLQDTSRIIQCTEKELKFFLSGRPIPKGRPRFSLDWTLVHQAIRANRIQDILKAIRVRTPKKTKIYESRIADLTRNSGFKNIARQTYEIYAVFHMQDIFKSDIDNLLKAVLDGMNGIIYQDDRYCIKTTAIKRKVLSPAEEGLTAYVKILDRDPVLEEDILS